MSSIDPPHYTHHRANGVLQARFCLGWVHLAHVNRRWRRLLLAMPPLWAKVFSTLPGPPALEEALSRAGNAPLHIILDDEPDFQRTQRLLALALSQMERVEVLHNPNAFDWIAVLHDRNLPKLVHLDITQHPQPASDFLLRSPSLQDCTLRCLPAQLITPESLRRLVMEGSPALTSSTSLFLDTLRSMPTLEDLDLTLSADRPLVWADGDCRVTLAHLRNITLTGTPESDIIGF